MRSWESFLSASPQPGDDELAAFCASYEAEVCLPAAMAGPDNETIFASLGECVARLAFLHAGGQGTEFAQMADFLRAFGSPDWKNLIIDGQSLADRVSGAWTRGLTSSGDAFRSGREFPGKEKEMVIESRHPGARDTQSRTQTRAVFNAPVLFESVAKMVRSFTTRLASPERDPAWVAALRAQRGL